MLGVPLHQFQNLSFAVHASTNRVGELPKTSNSAVYAAFLIMCI